MDLSSILPLMMGGNGNNQMANMLGAMMGGGAPNNVNTSGNPSGNGLDMAGLMNMMSGMNGGADNAQGNSMAAMLPMLMSMMNGNNNAAPNSNNSAQDTNQATYSDTEVMEDTDINYSMYKHMQEQARRGL